MERARELGYTRSIGISNFNVGEMQALLDTASLPPAVNQVQFSPFEYRRGLLGACQQGNVALEAYSPLGTGRHLSDQVVIRVAERVGRTPAQVLLRWCVQHDVPVISKSTHRERIQENALIFDFTLSDQDLADLDGLDQTHGTDRALARPWW
jgi:2,5-diketo-D-gluconate reductase A